MRSLRQLARAIAAVSVALLAMGPMLDMVHDLEQQHEWCEAHKHVVHVGAGSTEPAAAVEAGSGVQRDAEPFAEESECETWLLRLPVDEWTELPSASPDPGTAPAFAATTLIQSRGVLERAPKQGPPLT